MVFSKIKQSIHYEETATIELLDKNMNFNVYEHTLFGIDLELCIGNINNINKIHNVLYCPVYLVKTNNNVIKIGIIEFKPIQMSYIFDENNDIELDNVDILLYSFVTPEYINSIIIVNDEDLTTTPPTNKPNHVEKVTDQSAVSSSSPLHPPPQPPTIPTQTHPINNITPKTRLNIINANEIVLNPINSSCKKSRKNNKLPLIHK